jgi:hypothetical protein
MSDHSCIDCGAPAEWAFIDESGDLLGYICDACDYKRRRRRMGWRRRTSRRLRRTFKL